MKTQLGIARGWKTFSILITRPWVFYAFETACFQNSKKTVFFPNKSKFARENWRIFFATAIYYTHSAKHAYDMGKISIKLVNKKNSSLWQTAIECMDIMQIVTSKTESSKSKMTALFCQRRLSGLFYFPEVEILGTVTKI